VDGESCKPSMENLGSHGEARKELPLLAVFLLPAHFPSHFLLSCQDTIRRPLANQMKKRESGEVPLNPLMLNPPGVPIP
jgi:hypothetical protein